MGVNSHKSRLPQRRSLPLLATYPAKHVGTHVASVTSPAHGAVLAPAIDDIAQLAAARYRGGMFTGELCSCAHVILAEILVLTGGVIPPAPADRATQY